MTYKLDHCLNFKNILTLMYNLIYVPSHVHNMKLSVFFFEIIYYKIRTNRLLKMSKRRFFQNIFILTRFDFENTLININFGNVSLFRFILCKRWDAQKLKIYHQLSWKFNNNFMNNYSYKYARFGNRIYYFVSKMIIVSLKTKSHGHLFSCWIIAKLWYTIFYCIFHINIYVCFMLILFFH